MLTNAAAELLAAVTLDRAPAAPMIVVDDLVKSYPKRRSLWERFRTHAPPRSNILEGLSFSVGRGELLGLLGANGAGKTTLLHSIAALAYWDSGEITIDGVAASEHPLAIRRMVGLSTVEGSGFYRRLSVNDNLRFFATLYDVPARKLQHRCDDVLELVNLVDKKQSRYHTLSTGMRQRLTIARALLSDPKLLLLDEPTRAVDPVNTRMLRELIRHTLVEQLGKTVILATNVLEEAFEMSDRVAVLRAGKITNIATPRDLERHVTGGRTYRILVDRADEPYVERLRAVHGVRSVVTSVDGSDVRIDVEVEPLQHSLTALLQALSSGGTDVRDISFQGAHPADIFAALTTGHE